MQAHGVVAGADNSRDGATLKPPDFHAELDAERGKGLLTRVLTGYEENTKVYYAAFWTK